MDEDDVLSTRRHQVLTVPEELEAAGFKDPHEIGRGGFGVVYRCVQPDLDRIVAVKVLTADLSEDNRTRFLREQQAMGRLTGHPHIVTILQVGATESDYPYIVMEFLPSDSLATVLQNNGPFALEEVLRIGVKLAGALETAHRLGILHRDVKPGNVLLTEYGEPALTDFGIARIAGGFETEAGIVTGSPAYTAPEVLHGGASSPASDLYGLGATLFSALTGHAAFERHSGEDVVAQFLRVTTLPVPDLREHRVPDDVAQVIGHAMAADPNNRYASAAEFGDELRQIQRRHHFHVDDMALRPDQDHAQMPRDEAADSSPHSGRGPEISAHVAGLPKSNLPTELTEFVGRRHEIASVKKTLATSRLVTLTGIGGVGKTRLALRIAQNVQRAYSGGVWLVELGELHDGSLVPDVFAAAFGIRNHSERNLEDVLAEFIGSRDLLLVVDNCEQVVESVAKLADLLLRACANLRILATSREHLGIIGESVVRVPSLSSPNGDGESSLKAMLNYDAIRLFADRACAAVPTFEITDSNKDTIARICRRLDGLPLAIELAAARLRSMSVEQILQRLTDRYALLTRGSRTAPTRQQTLSACIDWSFDLCTAREQLMWGRMSVFAGSFDLDAAEQVCGADLTPDEVADLVSSLVEKSILIQESTGHVVRFRILETLREYGHTKLGATGEYSTLRQRHLHWYEQLVSSARSEWVSSRQVQWISRLEREQANLREALELSAVSNPDVGLRVAASLYHFWHARGLFGEG
ncbi:protein kinase domain-containing protein, partial [Rhodococcus globerulus]